MSSNKVRVMIFLKSHKDLLHKEKLISPANKLSKNPPRSAQKYEGSLLSSSEMQHCYRLLSMCIGCLTAAAPPGTLWVCVGSQGRVCHQDQHYLVDCHC